ncbi:UNVERIFIED_CONTAM: Plant UBX domain-containing protein 11 [Sesamum radiatum]|uniref:Plant UBX domain-containing protein 11 n=1 Tax=Sesamum radiatum TaxID=300843 RepID=A0AAW2QFT7_SESRA
MCLRASISAYLYHSAKLAILLNVCLLAPITWTDLGSTLSDLGLFNRQALVVVPNNQNNLHHRGVPSHYEAYSSNDAGSSSEGGGYWAFLRRILSYANPFAYLSGDASTPSATQESQNGVWQYSPNPSLQNALRDRGRPSPINSSDTSGRNSNSSSVRRQQTSRSFGGNIHTLKHDDDDDDPGLTTEMPSGTETLPNLVAMTTGSKSGFQLLATV